MKKTLIIVALLALLLLAACSQDKVSREDFDLMYAHLSQMWAQSLEHADAENAFFGDSTIIWSFSGSTTSWKDAIFVVRRAFF